jgi:NTE family protein
MMRSLHQLSSRPVGLALSGGSVRGLAHIGVIKVLAEHGIHPAFVAGTSAGSLIGAMLAAGLDWEQMAGIARTTFWPKLLHAESLEKFCGAQLPATFADLDLPFAAITTEMPCKQALVLSSGDLASALSASCAIRVIRGAIHREGKRLKDGGIACVLPSQVCRSMGAEFIIGSDVWEIGSVLRGAGIHPHHPKAGRAYPSHYQSAVRDTDLLIHPRIPLIGYIPGPQAVDRMIAAGERAARQALHRFAERAAKDAHPLVPCG